MSKVVEWVKGHPYESLGVVLAVITIVLLIRNARSSGGATDNSAAINASASQYIANQQSSTALAQINAQVSALSQNDQAAVAIAKLQADAATTANTNNTTASTTETQLLASVQQAVQLAGVAAQTTINANNNATSQAIAALQAGVTTNATNQSANIEQSLINTLNPASATTNLITGEYQSKLGRTPTSAEISFYDNYIASGGSTSNLDAFFTNSAEYKSDVAAGKIGAGGNFVGTH